MKKEVYQAAVRGDIKFLREARDVDLESTTTAYNADDFLALTSQRNNIIHVATKHGQLDFIKDAIASFPAATKQLLCQPNSDGDTPLHLAAKQSTRNIGKFIVDLYNLCAHDHVAGEMEIAPWKIRNNKGNTPLHVALMNGGRSIQVATFLFEIGPEVASCTNKREETPLHLAVNYDTKCAEISTINLVNSLNGKGASLTYTQSLFKQDSLSVVKLLLGVNSSVCCLRNADGMTPLLKAASNSYLRAVEAIIESCPESVELCDFKGRNILHHINLPTYLETREFLSKLEVSALLMDQQDNDGNTAMHIAVMNNNVGMVKAMFEKNANFALKNHEGVSPVSQMIQSELNLFQDLMKNVNNRMSIKDELLSKELYEAAGKGDWGLLTRKLDDLDNCEKLFLTRLPDGSNIFHIAVENSAIDFEPDFAIRFMDGFCSKERFLVEALKKFPILSFQTNRRGQTPLHVAMNHRILNPDGELFGFLEEHFKHVKDQASSFVLPPWKAKDVDGNTLLHLALKYCRFKFAKYLIKLDPEIIGEINSCKETPLHMLCQNVSKGEYTDMVDLLLQHDVSAAYLHDADGFTPILRAIHHNMLQIAVRILHHCPQSIRHYDSQGRNIFHWIMIDQDDDRIKELCKVIPEIEFFMRTSDDENNTPLHLAIKNSKYGTAKYLMKRFDELKGCKELSYNIKTVPDLLGAAQDVPRWFGDFMAWKVCELPREFIWGKTRSAYGIRKTEIKEYINPIGLVAALLTTITFTAAFTVPGGYNNDNGTPFLANKIAFRIFMLSDVIGLCSSMVVLFCVLWFQTAYHNDDEEELRLVDLTIILLQLSFYATLVAFMMGVYATTSSYMPWFAICTCILCSSLILLMRKRCVLGIMVRVFYYLHYSIKYGFITVMHFTKKSLHQISSS